MNDRLVRRTPSGPPRRILVLMLAPLITIAVDLAGCGGPEPGTLVEMSAEDKAHLASKSESYRQRVAERKKASKVRKPATPAR